MRPLQSLKTYAEKYSKLQGLGEKIVSSSL